MGKLEKAQEYYLRGFNGQYIKRHTGISIQSLLKTLAGQGIKYTEDDRQKYQIEYIKNKYTIDDIKKAYREMSDKHADIYKAGHSRKIEMLGCGFGNHAKVIKAIIGDDEYNALRNECWQKKQQQSMMRMYNTDNVFRKEIISAFVSEEAVKKGRMKRTQTMIEKYGVEQPNQNAEICNKMQETLKNTNLKKYGVEHAMQVSEIAKKSAENRQNAMMEKYGAKNSAEIPEIRNMIFEARRKNNTLNTSEPEVMLGCLLREKFGDLDVISNKIIDNRYPYHVDFYIKSLDLFIELNGDRSHYTHWFDKNNPQDLQVLDAWTENMIRIETQTGKKSRYRKYIKTWTETDVAKRQKAKENKLNYLVFWDGSSRKQNKHTVPNLKDVYEWFAENCPMPDKWRSENTY